jgi:hypothetical protein
VTELRRAIPFLLVPLLLLVAGCSLLPWELPGVEASPLAGGESRARLEAQRATWEAAGITSYRLEVRFGCFCPATDPVTVTVTDGLVADVRTQDGQPAPSWYDSFPLTVDAIYAEAARVLDNGGTAEVTYGDGGVPRGLSLDPIPNAVDDELGIEVLGFTPQP